MIKLEEVRNLMAAAKAVDDAQSGSFALLANRLRSGQDLTKPERIFLSDLLTEKTAFKISWANGRSRRRPEVEENEIALANYVYYFIIQRGLSLEKACAEADLILRPDRAPRPATARAAYDKWRLPIWPAGSNGVQELPDFEE